MDFEEYRSLDGIALNEAMAAGEIGPADAMRIAIDAAQALDHHCNAISYRRYDEALAEASRKSVRSGDFDGVPFLLKDSGLAAHDIPTSIGSRLFEGTSSPSDATLAARFRDAGFITFARTTVPEMCMAPTTEAVRNGGPTRNPFDLSRSSGGSSGGAAVAVAAGVVPVAHGSDGGGSIRIPASACGVYGMKPSRGRVPMGPFRGEGWAGLACDGVLTRSVRDTARALDLVSGYESGAPYAAPPGGAFESELGRPFERRLRIGVWRDPWGVRVDDACMTALEATVELCTALGYEVIPVEPPEFDYGGFLETIVTVMSTNIALSVGNKLAGAGRQPTNEDLEPAILDGYRRGVDLKAADYAQAINTLHATGRMMASMLDGLDVVISPTLAKLPIELGTLSTGLADFAAFRHQVGELTPFLAVGNASGQPSASLPLWRHEGLPIGIQVIGGFGDEATILRLSAELEKTEPWKNAAAWPQLNLETLTETS